MDKCTSADRSAKPEFVCPDCGSSQAETIYEERSFAYGEGSEAVQISVTLPVHVCLDCKSRWMDSDAEDAEHDAVCRHLHLLTPSDITRLREKHDLSRVEFARITKLGEATLARWEKGALIQNGAYDQLLYLLLKSPSNLELLRQRNSRSNLSAQPSFRCLEKTKSMEERANNFELRGTASLR